MHAHFTRHVYHRHSHESYSFGVTEVGAQTFTCRGTRHVSSTGLVMAFNPDDPHDGHADDDAGFTYRMIHIWPEDYAGLLGGSRGSRALALPLFREPVIDDPALARALLRLHGTLTGAPADGGASADGASALVRAERLMAAVRIADRHASRRSPDFSGFPGFSGSGPDTVTREIAARVRRRIHDGEPGATMSGVTMDDLAAAAGCSRYAAYRAFSAVFGMAPSDYQRQLRVRAARRLLASGIAPAVAAAEAGFADQAHLTRWFRRYYGVTPGAYRAAA
jgi:AraC-like DNA-binding protein